jgi:Ca-activated chloride channel family protein
MRFENPYAFVIAPILIVVFFLLLRRRSRVGFSALWLLDGADFLNVLLLQKVLLSAVAVLVAVALAGPYTQAPGRISSRDARDVVLLLDISGSMESVSQGEKKIDRAKRVVKEFVEGRPQDRIALISFDTGSYLNWPLSFAEVATGEHDRIISQLARLKEGGGTEISKALEGALEHLEVFGESRGKAIILISDGVSTLSETQREELAERIKASHVNVYWVWIQDDETPEASSSHESSLTVQMLMEMVDGKTYKVQPKDLAEALADVGRLETSPVTFQEDVQRSYHHGPLLLAALAILGFVIIFEFATEV